jgi:hypothetical protein
MTYKPVLKKGQRVQFHLNNLTAAEFGNMEIDVDEFDGQHATIVDFDSATAGQDDEPDQDFEYYTIRFENGVVWEAISGYHLTVVE